MPKPKPVIKLERVEFKMPGRLHAEMLLRLYSPLEEKVPYGAVSKYITDLIRDDLERRHAAEAEKPTE